jgi:hypothetical protein
LPAHVKQTSKSLPPLIVRVKQKLDKKPLKRSVGQTASPCIRRTPGEISFALDAIDLEDAKRRWSFVLSLALLLLFSKSGGSSSGEKVYHVSDGQTGRQPLFHPGTILHTQGVTERADALSRAANISTRVYPVRRIQANATHLALKFVGNATLLNRAENVVSLG